MLDIDKLYKDLPIEALEEIKKYFEYDIRHTQVIIEHYKKVEEVCKKNIDIIKAYILNIERSK